MLERKNLFQRHFLIRNRSNVWVVSISHIGSMMQNCRENCRAKARKSVCGEPEIPSTQRQSFTMWSVRVRLIWRILQRTHCKRQMCSLWKGYCRISSMRWKILIWDIFPVSWQRNVTSSRKQWKEICRLRWKTQRKNSCGNLFRDTMRYRSTHSGWSRRRRTGLMRCFRSGLLPIRGKMEKSTIIPWTGRQEKCSENFR